MLQIEERTCHAAIIARELGIPAIVGTINGTSILEKNKEVTISCGEGEKGYVYEGKLDFTIEETNISDSSKKLSTQLMVNIGNPENCFHSSMIPNEGVGLVRMEFIINNYIKVHPKALLKMDSDDKFKEEQPLIYDKIEKTIVNMSQGGANYFIERLSNGIARIAGAFLSKRRDSKIL